MNTQRGPVTFHPRPLGGFGFIGVASDPSIVAGWQIASRSAANAACIFPVPDEFVAWRPVFQRSSNHGADNGQEGRKKGPPFSNAVRSLFGLDRCQVLGQVVNPLHRKGFAVKHLPVAPDVFEHFFPGGHVDRQVRNRLGFPGN